MFKIDFSKTYNNSHLAHTLSPSDLGKHDLPDGWEIEGEVQEDWYEWVNDFTAKKGKWKVYGDFESVVYATNEKAYNDFMKYHEPTEWDYWDI